MSSRATDPLTGQGTLNLPNLCMELEHLVGDTCNVSFDEIEVSPRVDKVKETIQTELRTLEYFAPDRLHCQFSLHTFPTVEGHTSV